MAYNRLELYVSNAYCYYVLGDHREPDVFKTDSTRPSGMGERTSDTSLTLEFDTISVAMEQWTVEQLKICSQEE